MTDIICPLCGKPNSPDRDECLYCQAPLKVSGFIASPESGGGEAESLPPPDNVIGPAIDDDWLASLLAEAGGESDLGTPQEESSEEPGEALMGDKSGLMTEEPIETQQPAAPEPAEKPEWLTDLEASSTIKFEGGMPAFEPENEGASEVGAGEEKGPGEVDLPEWVAEAGAEVSPPGSPEPDAPITPAVLPDWLEVLRPDEDVSPTAPVE